VVISIHRHWRLEAFRGIWKIVFALRRRGYHKHSRISYSILNVVGTLHVGSTIKSLNFEMGLALVAVTPKSSFSISDDYDDSSRLSTGSSSFSACVCSLQLVFQSPSLLFSFNTLADTILSFNPRSLQYQNELSQLNHPNGPRSRSSRHHSRCPDSLLSARHPVLHCESHASALQCLPANTVKQTCLTEVGTTLCATHALYDLTPCLAKTCANPPATQNLIASLDVAISPKAKYSCQQAYGPSNPNTEASSVTLSLNGTCATSPYKFKSYLPQSVSSIRASIGCGIITFSDEDCLGEAGSSDVGTLDDGKCVFRGGRSARLTCRNELDGMCCSRSPLDISPLIDPN
jgi:hypothetical protein